MLELRIEKNFKNTEMKTPQSGTSDKKQSTVFSMWIYSMYMINLFENFTIMRSYEKI